MLDKTAPLAIESRQSCGGAVLTVGSGATWRYLSNAESSPRTPVFDLDLYSQSTIFGEQTPSLALIPTRRLQEATTRWVRTDRYPGQIESTEGTQCLNPDFVLSEYNFSASTPS